jgi:RHS repeat-associated protein
MRARSTSARYLTASLTRPAITATTRSTGGSEARLYFHLTDHMGSTSVISDSTGTKVAGSDVVFAPYGDIRTPSDQNTLTTLTDFMFTGQRLDRSTGGLMDYGARYYLPGLARFISADTIVPGVSNPQTLNRYSYALGNPVKYTDPSGHLECASGDQTCAEWVAKYYADLKQGIQTTPAEEYTAPGGGIASKILSELAGYGVTIAESERYAPDDQLKMITNIWHAVEALANNMAEVLNNQRRGEDGAIWSPADAFKALYKATVIKIEQGTGVTCGGNSDAFACNHNISDGAYQISIASAKLLTNTINTGVRLVAHEISHNLTDQGFTFANAWTYKKANFFGVNASSITGDLGEESADAYASWALHDFNAGEIAQSGLTDKNGNPITVAYVSTAISCTIVPSGSGCGR